MSTTPYHVLGTSESSSDDHAAPEPVHLLMNEADVLFPFKPYPAQVAIMNNVTAAIKDGASVLAESATGTGKTLALLSATIAARQRLLETNLANKSARMKKKREKQREKLRKEMAEAEAQARARMLAQQSTGHSLKNTDDESTGENQKDKKDDDDDDDDDFEKPRKYARIEKQQIKSRMVVSDDEGDDDDSDEKKPSNESDKSSNQDGNNNIVIMEDVDDDDDEVGKLYFCTRTHSQVAQVFKELKRLPYHVGALALASKELYCLNPDVQKLPDRDQVCRDWVEHHSCVFEEGAQGMASHLMSKKPQYDVEDLVNYCRVRRACPSLVISHLSRRNAIDIYVSPYNYIVDPRIRNSMGLNLNNAIIIFDEAHNLSGALMEATSITIDLTVLGSFALPELKTLMLKRSEAASLIGPVEKFVQWSHDRISMLPATAFETHSNAWSGEDARRMFEQVGITDSNWASLKSTVSSLSQEEVETADSSKGKPGNSTDKNGKPIGKTRWSKMRPKKSPDVLTARTRNILEEMLLAAELLFSEGGRFVSDYRLVLERKRALTSGKWEYSLGLWCMSPAAGFSPIASAARTVILASGTLAPFDPLARELRHNFAYRAEMGHVVHPCQVFAAVVTQYEASYKHQSEWALQDGIGESLISLCKVIPSGVLCFFPSYSLLSKMVERWKRTGLYERLKATKNGNVYSEEAIRDPFAALAASGETPGGTFSSSSNVSVGSGASKQAFAKMMKNYRMKSSSEDGALMLTVCRGKASEGIDFADESARGVVIVGIPYPNVNDLRVKLKREHESVLAPGGGDAWYSLQGHSAVNQAIGRVIRHRWDYGAVVFLDSRYAKASVTREISKWVRNSLRVVPTTAQLIPQIDSFFTSARDYISKHAPQRKPEPASSPPPPPPPVPPPSSLSTTTTTTPTPTPTPV